MRNVVGLPQGKLRSAASNTEFHRRPARCYAGAYAASIRTLGRRGIGHRLRTGGDGWKRPRFAKCIYPRGVVLAGSLFQGLHGRMKEFVHQAASERFHGRGLFRRQRSKARLDAPQLSLAQLLCLALQRDDGRGHVDRAPPLMKALDFGANQRFGIAGGAVAVRNVAPPPPAAGRRCRKQRGLRCCWPPDPRREERQCQ